jgi:hypothetical protein
MLPLCFEKTNKLCTVQGLQTENLKYLQLTLKSINQFLTKETIIDGIF